MGAPEVEDAAGGGEGALLKSSRRRERWFAHQRWASSGLFFGYYMVEGVQVDPTAGGTGRLEGGGGTDHGTLMKSKKSSRLGWALSRLVRCAVGPMKRLSTNLMTAVWSMGTWET